MAHSHIGQKLPRRRSYLASLVFYHCFISNIAKTSREYGNEVASCTSQQSVNRLTAKRPLLLPQYLDGEEVDCDLIFSNGAAVYGAVTDNWPTVEPYFNETGSNCPSMLPANVQEELLQLAVRSVQALGLSLGVFHVECKQTSRGPRLIEVNCR